MQIKMTMSQNGVDTLLKPSEAWRDKPYNDGNHNASIAWGHLLHHGPVTPADWALYGKGITPAQGEVFLRADRAWAEQEVNKFVEPQLNQNQFDAIVDFVYNEGSGRFEHSHVLSHINAEEFDTACDVMLEYDLAGGQVEGGLETRRQKEVRLFKTPVAVVEAAGSVEAEPAE